MAKNIGYLIILLYLLCGCSGRISQDSVTVTLPDVLTETKDDKGVHEDADNNHDVVTTVPSNSSPVIDDVPKTLQDFYLSQLHVRELTGNNDGKDVEKYLKSVGFGKGYAWCAAFVHWCLEQAKIKNTVTAWSPTAENRKHLVFQSRKFLEEPQPGDVVTFYYTNLGRIGHTGFYNKRISDVTYESVEGNTDGGKGSREGNGVYKKFRPYNSTHSISRWDKQ